MEIGDGDLVRLARTGDAAAFRLLVERYAASMRARAGRLCARPQDAEDVVQEAFLQAFVALDRLRDPDRFGAWLAGIVLNVHRAAGRRAPLVLLPDWPEPLHPASVLGLPSADDLDRAEALAAGIAELPAGQRQAVELHYYADLPAGSAGASPGAARASLLKARRRLREYIIANRPDLVPVASRRAPMITVRIACAEPQVGQPLGGAAIGPVLVVLVEDQASRALPLWLSGMEGYAVWRSADQPGTEPSGMPGDIPPGQTASAGLLAVDLASRLLHAAAVPVAGVEIDELGPGVLAARIEVTSPAGPQHVTVRAGIGLALATATGAPIRVTGALMDRLAVPVTDDDLPGQFLARRPAGPPSPLPMPQNLAFAEGLDGWITGGSFQTGPTMAHWQDYSAAAADGAAILGSAVPNPSGDAFLGQAVAAESYRGAAVSLRAEVRADGIVEEAGLFLHVVTAASGQDRETHGPVITGSHGWAMQQITAQVPADAVVIRFGLTLTGPGQAGLRNVELIRISTTPEQKEPR
jgi:RNA polymerase sigma factor (sigma-70 family)